MKSPGPRKASVTRKTRETTVSVTLDLDGTGRYDVKIGHRFLEHMLESLARFASFDLTVRAAGDQEHHIWEDVALTLGGALRKALGTAPVRRVGFALLPMDEALLAVAVDLVDRPFADVNRPSQTRNSPNLNNNLNLTIMTFGPIRAMQTWPFVKMSLMVKKLH